MRGRKPSHESRSTEFRQKLANWKRTPESLRPSLRALARELGTSHQLLKHYLDGLEKWRYKERYRKANTEADQILARAIVEDRPMTQWEEQQRHAWTIAAIRAKAGALLLDKLKKLQGEARRGPLHPAQFKMVKIFAKQGFPGAQELLQKCSQVGQKVRKRFSEIVKETPRREGETEIAWVRRIWDQCDNYDSEFPAVVTLELLEKYSQGSVKNRKNNLPPISSSGAKSLRRA
jgi:hypothetical protein